MASPSPGAKKMTADEMILPTKNGMNAIIDASVKNLVKKIVVTSSIITVLGNLWKRNTGNHHYTQSDFAPVEAADPFGKSKIAQESICREFLQE